MGLYWYEVDAKLDDGLEPVLDLPSVPKDTTYWLTENDTFILATVVEIEGLDQIPKPFGYSCNPNKILDTSDNPQEEK